jgi:capsular exopolysaccharide synthesis family protein
MLEGLVQETDIPGLSAVTSGPIPPNPSELLGSPKLVALMHRFLQDGHFDHVIFDTTPALSVTDAVVLASHVDSTILVVRARVTTHDALAQSVAMLQQSHANLSGIILNAVPQEVGYYYSRYRRYADHYLHSRDSQASDGDSARDSEESAVSSRHYTNTG